MLISMVYFVCGTFIVVIGKKRKQVQIYEDIIKKFVPVILIPTAIFSVNRFSRNKLLLYLIAFSTLLNDQQKLLYCNYG